VACYANDPLSGLNDELKFIAWVVNILAAFQTDDDVPE